VRARLCSDWIAIRPEELLARLREAGMSALTRKDFMDSVMDVGPGIVRGRSVKFGRDTRRALAIPRMHFSPDELAIIDDGQSCFYQNFRRLFFLQHIFLETHFRGNPSWKRRLMRVEI
jgi:hypothetical protein